MLTSYFRLQTKFWNLKPRHPFEQNDMGSQHFYQLLEVSGTRSHWSMTLNEPVINIQLTSFTRRRIKECGMGPWLVLVSPCFRENVVVTCKIGSFSCSLDNLLQKNVIILFLETKFQNGAHLKKGLFLT